MSVKELKFYDPMNDSAMVIYKDDNKIVLKLIWAMNSEAEFKLDRNHAHLLEQYIKDYLNE